MEKGIRAFFYDYKYYMFPDGVSSLKELKAMGSVDAKRLKEEYCMAPDFVYESIEDEHVEFDDPDKVFEVFVNLYGRDEYNGILRENVKRVCPSCEFFEDNGDDALDGHYREMALSGTCYIRRDKNARFDYSEAFDWYWSDIATKLNDLAECIDRNDQKRLNEILNKDLSDFFFEVDFFGAVMDGKYTLCMQNLLGAMSDVMCLYFIFALAARNENSPIKNAGWQVLPYLPAGITYSDFDVETPLIKLTSSHDGRELPYVVEVYDPREQELKNEEKYEVLRQAYLGLCSFVGEPLLLNMTSSFVLTSDDNDLVSMREGAKLIDAARKKYAEGEDMTMFPPQRVYGVQSGIDLSEISFPFREKLESGASKCLELSCLTKDINDPSAEYWKLFSSFAYVFVPRSMNDPVFPMSVLSRYFANSDRVPIPIRNPHDSSVVGMMIGLGDCGEAGYVVDHMIVSEKAFFRKLRILAPVLKAYGAKVVIVNKDGAAAYECDYEFLPIEA